PLPVTVSNAQVTVLPGSGASATPTSTLSPTPTRTPSPSTTPSLTPTQTPSPTRTPSPTGPTSTPTATGTTTQEGEFTNTPVPGGTHTPTPQATIGSSAQLGVSPPSKQVSVGDQFTLDIALANVDQATDGITLRVDFDPAVLTCDSIDEGTFYSSYADQHGGSTYVQPEGACDNATGTTGDMGVILLVGAATPGAAHYGGATGSGPVFTIHFTAKAN